MDELFYSEDDSIFDAQPNCGPGAPVSQHSRPNHGARYPELSTALFAYSTLDARAD